MCILTIGPLPGAYWNGRGSGAGWVFSPAGRSRRVVPGWGGGVPGTPKNPPKSAIFAKFCAEYSISALKMVKIRKKSVFDIEGFGGFLGTPGTPLGQGSVEKTHPAPCSPYMLDSRRSRRRAILNLFNLLLSLYLSLLILFHDLM